MDNETDGKVRESKSRHTRPTRIVERFDFEKGDWYRIEIREDDEIFEMSEDVRDAYLDIVTTISDMMTSENYKEDKQWQIMLVKTRN